MNRARPPLNMMKMMRMTSLPRQFFLLALCLFASSCGPSSTSSSGAIATDNPQTEGPSWQCRKTTHDIGTVWAGPVIRFNYYFRNVGTEPLEIYQVTSSCGCATAGEFERIIEPGVQGKIPMQIITSNLGFTELDKVVNVVTNDDENKLVKLRVQGVIRERIEMRPATGAVFGRVLPGSPVTKEIRFKNNLPEPMSLALRPGTGKERFSRTLHVDKPGEEYRLVVEFSPPKEGGSYRGDILVDTGIENPSVLRIHCSALVPRRMEVHPARVFLPPKLTREEKRLIRVTRHVPKPIVVTGATVNDPEVGVSFEAKGDVETVIHLTFPAGFEFPESDLFLTIATSDADTGALEVPIRSIDALSKVKGKRDRREKKVGTAKIQSDQPSDSIQLEPGSFDLRLTEGIPLSATVTVSSPGVLDFKVLSVKTTDSRIKATFFGPGASGGYVVKIKVPGDYRPSGTDLFVQMETNLPGHSEHRIPIEVSTD